MFHEDNETILLNNQDKSEQDLEELFAVKAIKHNPSILENPFSFEKVCYALNHRKPTFDYYEPASVLMMAKAIKILKDIVPNHNYDYEIRNYIAIHAHDEGWVELPEILSFANKELQDLNVKVELDEEMKQMQKMKHDAVSEYLK